MYFELGLIFLIFVLSYTLVLKNFRLSIYILLILSVLLHKELFSFYRWDLMPVRAYMLSILCAGVTKIYFWLFKSKNKLKGLEILKDPFIILVISLWIVRGISIIFSKNLQSSLLLYGFFTTIVFLVVFLINFFKNNQDRVLEYIKFYIYIVFGLSLFGYFQYYLYESTGNIIGAFWNIPGNIARVGATFWDVNHYGALIAALLPLSGILVLFEKPLRKKILFSIIFLSLLVTLFLTNSRTAWIIDGVAGLVFAGVFLIKKFGLKSLKYLFITLLLISIPFIREYTIKSSPFRAKIKQYFHYRMDSFDSHIMLLTGSFQIFEKFPLLGGGYGGFFEHFSQTKIAPTYFGRDPAALNTRVPAHTIWGELLAETGIVGFSIWVLFSLLLLTVLLKASLKTKDTKEFMLSNAMFSVIVGWFVAGIFYSYNSEFFWIILCLFFSYGVYVLKGDYKITKLVNFLISSKKFLPIILGIIGFVLIFVSLGKNHLVPWDESIYAKISKNMVISNEYITQVWKPKTSWYEKPPFYMWTMALSMKIIGFSSLAAKLPSAIFGFATLFVLYNFGKKLFNKTSAFLGSFALLTTVHFLYYTRQAMTDVTNLFFITLSLYLYWMAKEKNKAVYWILSGVSIGFAIMTKGVIGFLPFAVIGLYELYLLISKQQKFEIKNYILLFVFSLLIFLPWHVEMYRRFGDVFIGQYLGYHVIARATEAIEDKGQPWWWYTVVMKVSMRLWFVALLGAIPWIIFRLTKRDNKFVFLTIWALFTLTFFSIAKSKITWYIIPIYPAVSIIVGRFLERVLNFVMLKIPSLNNSVFKFMSIFLIIICSLMYLFYNKELFYPGDLTGQQARLLKLKDEKLGTEDRFFIDRIELPLVMFYTDSPFQVIDYEPEKGRIPEVLYEEDMIILGKRGRYEIDIPNIRAGKKVIGEENDWVLWYYESEYQVDKDLLKEVQRKIGKNEGDVDQLKAEEIKIVNRMESSKGKVIYYYPIYTLDP